MKRLKWIVGILVAVVLLFIAIWMFIEIIFQLVIMIIAIWALIALIGALSGLMDS